MRCSTMTGAHPARQSLSKKRLLSVVEGPLRLVLTCLTAIGSWLGEDTAGSWSRRRR